MAVPLPRQVSWEWPHKQPDGSERRQLWQVRGEKPKTHIQTLIAIKPSLLLFLSYCLLSPSERDLSGLLLLPLHLTADRLQVL